MRWLGDKPDGYLCLGPHFCWPVHGWRPNWLQRKIWGFLLGITWRKA